MTDAVAATAQAAAPEIPVAPIEQVASPPAPLSEAPPPAKEAPIEAAKAPTTREALRAAREKVEAAEAAKASPVSDGKADVKNAPERGEGGRFASKDKQTDGEAKPAAGADPAKPAEKPAAGASKPSAAEPPPVRRTVNAPERFSNDAKAVWDTAPEPVKAEVDRMHREMTAGIEKHRAGAERDEKLRPFHEMAQKGGTDLHSALTRYTQLEGLLRQNPMKGLEAVCDNLGVSLRQVAEVVLGQAPDQARAQSEQTIRELRQEIAGLKQQIGGIVEHSHRQAETSLEQHITDWARGWDHFEVFAPHIAAELQAGAKDLDAAYEAVLQKHPGLVSLARKAVVAEKPAAAEPAKPAASSAAEPDLTAQTDKGSKSIKGAPGAGSEPVTRQRSSSIREALKRAAARAG